MPTLRYAAFQPDHADAVTRLIALAFAGGPPEQIRSWMQLAGHDNIRVVLDDDTPLACLILIPMGQFFGGRSVPMTGIAGVAVAPQARGRGVARLLMTSALEEIRDSGVPLSTLYASTQHVYRSVGYEQAGHRFEHRIPIHRFTVKPPRPLRPFNPSDMDAVKACYTRWAALNDGHLDRGEYVWSRILRSRTGEEAAAFVLDGDRSIDAYVFFHQERADPSGRHDVRIADCCAVTREAADSLLGFLNGFRSMAVDVVLYGGPAHPLAMYLPEQRFDVRFKDYWMLRVLDPRSALERRGYPAGVSVTIPIEVEDATFPACSGRVVLTVRNGRATVERGCEGGLRLTSRALACAYSGLHTPSVLRALGWLDGPNNLVRNLDAAMPARSPSMPDFF